MDFVRNWLEWAYRLFRRKTHNRIALFLVISGVAMLAQPIWGPILRAVSDQLFDVKIDPPSSPIWGLSIIAFALIYHFGSMVVESSNGKRDWQAEQNKNQKRIDHDLKLANRFRDIFPEETKDYLEYHMLENHIYCETEMDALRDGIVFLASTEAHFLNRKIRVLADEFVRKSKYLRHFAAYKFFIFPKDRRERPMVYAMQPNLNVDREGTGDPEDMRKYGELTDELTERFEAMSESYNRLVRGFHEELTS